MAKSLIAAVLLAAALVGAVVVPAAITRGTFAFDAWPTAPGSKAHDEQVTIAAKPTARERIVARSDSHSTPAASAEPGPAADAATNPPQPQRAATTPRPHASTPVEQPTSGATRETDPAPAPPTPPVPEQQLAEGETTTAGPASEIDARVAVAVEDALPDEVEDVVPDDLPLPAAVEIDPPNGRHGPLPGWVGRGRPPHGHHRGMK